MFCEKFIYSPVTYSTTFDSQAQVQTPAPYIISTGFYCFYEFNMNIFKQQFSHQKLPKWKQTSFVKHRGCYTNVAVLKGTTYFYKDPNNLCVRAFRMEVTHAVKLSHGDYSTDISM